MRSSSASPLRWVGGCLVLLLAAFAITRLQSLWWLRGVRLWDRVLFGAIAVALGLFAGPFAGRLTRSSLFAFCGGLFGVVALVAIHAGLSASGNETNDPVEGLSALWGFYFGGALGGFGVSEALKADREHRSTSFARADDLCQQIAQLEQLALREGASGESLKELREARELVYRFWRSKCGH